MARPYPRQHAGEASQRKENERAYTSATLLNSALQNRAQLKLLLTCTVLFIVFICFHKMKTNQNNFAHFSVKETGSMWCLHSKKV